MNVLEAMRVRRSDRTYTGESLDQPTLDELLDIFDHTKRLNKLTLRCKLMPGNQVQHAMTGLIGSYGSIKNAPTWLIGLSEQGKNDQVNFGFAMEQWVLECTRMGLGTCWVGGFFKKSMLQQAVEPEENERIVCISPVGKAAPRRLAEKAMRAAGGLDRRKRLAERMFYETWGVPATDYLAEKKDLLQVLELARWAPSASNKQPSHFVLDEERIVISILTTLQRKYPSIIADDRAEDLDFQRVDAGISMAHVDLAARELGIRGVWSLDFEEDALREQTKIVPEARILGVFNFEK